MTPEEKMMKKTAKVDRLSLFFQNKGFTWKSSERDANTMTPQ